VSAVVDAGPLLAVSSLGEAAADRAARLAEAILAETAAGVSDGAGGGLADILDLGWRPPRLLGRFSRRTPPDVDALAAAIRDRLSRLAGQREGIGPLKVALSHALQDADTLALRLGIEPGLDRLEAGQATDALARRRARLVMLIEGLDRCAALLAEVEAAEHLALEQLDTATRLLTPFARRNQRVAHLAEDDRRADALADEMDIAAARLLKASAGRLASGLAAAPAADAAAIKGLLASLDRAARDLALAAGRP